MFEMFKNAIVEKLSVKPEDVKPETRLKEDLGADSLDLIDLIMELEEELGIEIEDDAAANFSTIQDVLDYIENNK